MKCKICIEVTAMLLFWAMVSMTCSFLPRGMLQLHCTLECVNHHLKLQHSEGLLNKSNAPLNVSWWAICWIMNGTWLPSYLFWRQFGTLPNKDGIGKTVIQNSLCYWAFCNCFSSLKLKATHQILLRIITINFEWEFHRVNFVIQTGFLQKYLHVNIVAQ